MLIFGLKGSVIQYICQIKHNVNYKYKCFILCAQCLSYFEKRKEKEDEKILSLFLSIILMGASFVTPVFAESGISTDNQNSNIEIYEKTLEQVDKVLQEHIELTGNRVEIEDKDLITRELSKLNLKALEGFFDQSGIDYGVELTPEYLFEMFETHVLNLNSNINDSKVILSMDTRTMSEIDSISLYSSGNVNRDTTHWWGRKRLKSKKNATKWSYDIKAASHLNAATGIGMAIFGGVAGIPNGLTAVYGYNFADRIDYHNGRTNRGIEANIHWTLTFSIKSQ